MLTQKGAFGAPYPSQTTQSMNPERKNGIRTSAVRYSHYFGDWDVGLHAFHGNAREPELLANDAGTELVPHYATITQAGLDLQYTREAWLWKLEGLVREGQGDTFGAMVGGVEYTHYQLLGSAADLGLLVEYHRDKRDEEAPATIYDNDLFGGVRLALNDSQDSQLLFGAVVDTDNDSTFVFAEAERRFGDNWLIGLEARIFSNIDQEDPGAIFERDDFLNLSIQRHF